MSLTISWTKKGHQLGFCLTMVNYGQNEGRIVLENVCTLYFCPNIKLRNWGVSVQKNPITTACIAFKAWESAQISKRSVTIFLAFRNLHQSYNILLPRV